MGFSKKNYGVPWYKNKMLILVFVLIITWLLYFGGASLQCKNQVEGMNAEWKYGVFAGCLIRPQGVDEWVPLANYRWLHD